MAPTMKAHDDGHVEGLDVALVLGEVLRDAPRARRVMMLAKMSSEMPLETPRSVICSPIHMRNAVPVVRVMTVRIWKPRPGWMTMPPPVSELEMLSASRAMPNDWKMLSAMVP